MAVVYAERCVGDQRKLHLADFKAPVGRADVEATGHGRKLDQVVVAMVLVMVQNDHVVCKEFLDVFFSIQVEPVFQTVSTECLEHQFLGKEVHLLGLLSVSLFIQADKFVEEILPDLLQRLSHVDLSLELGVH